MRRKVSLTAYFTIIVSLNKTFYLHPFLSHWWQTTCKKWSFLYHLTDLYLCRPIVKISLPTIKSYSSRHQSDVRPEEQKNRFGKKKSACGSTRANPKSRRHGDERLYKCTCYDARSKPQEESRKSSGKIALTASLYGWAPQQTRTKTRCPSRQPHTLSPQNQLLPLVNLHFQKRPQAPKECQ